MDYYHCFIMWSEVLVILLSHNWSHVPSDWPHSKQPRTDDQWLTLSKGSKCLAEYSYHSTGEAQRLCWSCVLTMLLAVFCSFCFFIYFFGVSFVSFLFVVLFWYVFLYFYFLRLSGIFCPFLVRLLYLFLFFIFIKNVKSLWAFKMLFLVRLLCFLCFFF